MNTEFPYITAIEVKDCFAYKDLGTIDVPPQNGKPFSHLILTGRNGSGKSTILKGVDSVMDIFLYEKNISLSYKKDMLKRTIDASSVQYVINHSYLLFLLENINLNFNNEITENNKPNAKKHLYTYFNAQRELKLDEVTSSTTMNEFETNLNQKQGTAFFYKKLKQYLVNKKINQAFAQLKDNKAVIDSINTFFNQIEEIISRFSQDKGLKLIFNDENFEFYLNYSSGVKHTLEQSSDGLAAFLNLLISLLLRTDLIRSAEGNQNFDPPGIVLIDEPENHLHIAAQYEVMPMLTTLFPNVQFIIATHSPAVISSIKNTVVYDITSRQSELDEVAGSSYSELMMTHFGLDNEYSAVADEIIQQVNTVLKENRNNKPTLKKKLSIIYEENRRYLSPTLSLELEALILENEL